MKAFSKILEEIESERFYKINAQLQLIVKADNEGEAGYLSDSILSGIEETYDYEIQNIEQTDERISENLINESKSKIKKEIKGDDYHMVAGIIDILKKVKDKDNRMEIAQDMISQFKREKIKFDYEEFLKSVK